MPYDGTQQYDPQFGPRQFGAGPQGPGQYAGSTPGQRPGVLAALRSRGPLIPALAVGAAAVIAIIALVVVSNSPASPNATAATSGTLGTGATISPARGGESSTSERTAAVALNKLLSQSGKYRAEVNVALDDVLACRSLRASRDTFGASASNRRNLLAKLAVLPDHSALPATMLQDLASGWKASIQVDTDFHAWTQDEISRGCNPKTVTSDPNYQASNGYETPASTGKAEFAQAWRPVAAKFGLPAYTQYQL